MGKYSRPRLRGRLAGAFVVATVALGGVLVPEAAHASPSEPAAHVAASVSVADAVAQILADTNALRAAGGLAPLVESASIDTVAQNWSAQMYAKGSLTHNPDFSTQIPSGWTAASENIAVGYTASTVVEAWHQSAGHYANIMGDYNTIGIGYYELNGLRYFTQDFGKYATVPSPVAGTRSFVSAAYQDVLGRTPSNSELSGWASLLYAGVSRAAVASGFNNSDEYRLNKIDSAYEDVLGRPAETAGRAGWLDAMRKGYLQPDDADRVFLSTDEFYKKSGGGTDPGYIAALYTFILHRTAADHEITGWLTVLRSQGRQSVVDGFWRAPETERSQVAQMYESLLGRTASSREQAYWAATIAASGQTTARTQIMSSQEYYNRAIIRFP